MLEFPFEATPADLQSNMEAYVDAIFLGLASEFLVMPRGEGFIEYGLFSDGYESLKAATHGFTYVDRQRVMAAIEAEPICAIVLRSMLGFTPSEWAYVASDRTDVLVDQGFARSFDRSIRMSPHGPLTLSPLKRKRVEALVTVASQLLVSGAPLESTEKLHRLDKADTRGGLSSIQHLANSGVPYSVLLYERFLGRPFAGHRDSVSELVGDVLELAIKRQLDAAGISHRQAGRATKFPGFDQSPDFIVPDEFNPKVVIEAKITEDDGTARDKVTRVQHLQALSTGGGSLSVPKFEVIACIGGRGFKVRREDMRKLILATNGKVFTMATLPHMVANTRLSDFRTA